MITHAYCIYDRKSLAYHPPFFAPTDGYAVRMFSDAVSDSNTMFGRHPNDFVLFHVGDFDDAKGALLPVSPLVHVVDASTLIKAVQSEIPFPEQVTGNGLQKEA